MDDMDRADGLFQTGFEAGLENMSQFPRMSGQEILGHIAELDAEIKRSKEAGESCPNVGEDFDRAIRDLKDARERINELGQEVWEAQAGYARAEKARDEAIVKYTAQTDAAIHERNQEIARTMVARAKLAECSFFLERVSSIIRCQETATGKHEWRKSHQWDDPNEPHWCCRCALEAAYIVDMALDNMTSSGRGAK